MPDPRPTSAATTAYAARHARRAAPGHFRPLAGWTVSSIGLGTYLGDCDAVDDRGYEEAALLCLARGVNLLDTAINYRCQRSERALGRALRRADADGIASRDEVVLCTKGGYIPVEDGPPASAESYRAYVRRRFIEPGLCQPEEIAGGQHCIAPAYLRDQVRASLANLGVERIDIYYIHNPEAQLQAVGHGEFLARIRVAFEALEALCDEGRIGIYGVATWSGFRAAPEARDHLGLPALADLAREVGGDGHRFRIVQLPYNIAMPEAAMAETQTFDGRRATPLEVGEGLGIGVVASASLFQARLAGGLPAELRGPFPNLRTDAQRALQFARSTPGITCALVGMRDAAHVDENLELVAAPPTPGAIRRLLGR